MDPREHYEMLLNREFRRVPFAEALARLVGDYDGDDALALAQSLEVQAAMLRAQ